MAKTKTPVVTDAQFGEVPGMLAGRQAVVFKGCGGDINEWTDGLNKAFKGVCPPVKQWYRLTTTGGRIDLVMPVPKGAKVGRLAIARLEYQGSWWDDYVANYSSHHWVMTPALCEESGDDEEDDEYEG